MKIQSPTPADITAQREAATIGDERACFVDSGKLFEKKDYGQALLAVAETS